MIRRTTWFFVGAFAVLLAAVLLIPKWQQGHPQPTATAAAEMPLIIPSTQGKVTEIKITGADGKSLSLQTSDQAQWSVVQTDGLVWDTTQVNTAATGLVTGRVLNELPTQPPADAMGLDKPTDAIGIRLDNGTEKILNVGKETPAGNAYYVQMNGDPAVVVSKSIIDDLVALLTAGKPPVTPTPEVTPTAVQ